MRWKQLFGLVILPATLWLMLIALAGCQTTASAGTDRSVACQAFKPIYWSKSDTVETAKQAIEHNAAWKALCQKP